MPRHGKAVAVQRHVATDSTQLDLFVNDIVVVTEKEASGWWGGCKEGDTSEKTGWFRASHVHLFQEAEPNILQGEVRAGPTRTSGVQHSSIPSSLSLHAASYVPGPGSADHVTRMSTHDGCFPSVQYERATSRTRGSATPPASASYAQMQMLPGAGCIAPQAIITPWGGGVTSGVLQTPRCVAAPQTATADVLAASNARASDGSATRASVGATTSARSSCSSSGTGAAPVTTMGAPASLIAQNVQQAPGSGGFPAMVDASSAAPGLSETTICSAGTGEPPAVSRQSTANSGVGGTTVSAPSAQPGDGASEPGASQVGLDQATAAYLESRAAELSHILSEIADVSRETRCKQESRKSAKLQELGAALRAERERSRELECRLASEIAERERAVTESKAVVRQLETVEVRARQLEQQVQENSECFARQLDEERARSQTCAAQAERSEALEELERQLKEEQARSQAYAEDTKKLRAQQNANQLMKKLYEQKLEDKEMELRELQQRLQHRDRIHDSKMRELQAQLQSLRQGSGATDVIAVTSRQGEETDSSQQPSLADMLAEMVPAAPAAPCVDVSTQQVSMEEPTPHPGSNTRRRLSYSTAAAEMDTETPVLQNGTGEMAECVFDVPQETWNASPVPPAEPEDEQIETPRLGESPSVDALQMLVEPEPQSVCAEGPSPQPPALTLEMDGAPQSSLSSGSVAIDKMTDRPSGQGLAAQAAAMIMISPRKQAASNPRAWATRRSSSECRPPALAGDTSQRRIGSHGPRVRGEARSESNGPVARSSRLTKETPPRGLVAEKVSIFEKRSQSPRSPRGAAPGALRRGPQAAAVATPLGPPTPQNSTRLWRDGSSRRGGPPVAPAIPRSPPE